MSLVSAVVAYRIMLGRNEKLAMRMAGLSGGLFGAGFAAVCVTILVGISANPDESSVLSSRSTAFQSEVFERLTRQSPVAVRHKLRYLLPIPEGELLVSRFRHDCRGSNAADVAAEEVLLSISYPTDSHYGGSIEFGPDGYLYIGTGDGMYPLFSQDRRTLHGAILRIDARWSRSCKELCDLTDESFCRQAKKLNISARDLGIRSSQRVAIVVGSRNWPAVGRRCGAQSVRGS